METTARTIWKPIAGAVFTRPNCRHFKEDTRNLQSVEKEGDLQRQIQVLDWAKPSLKVPVPPLTVEAKFCVAQTHVQSRAWEMDWPLR